MNAETTHTTLERYLQSRGLKPIRLANQSGYSRQHLLRVRKGSMEPTRPCIAAITLACRVLAHEQVSASDLFDIG